MIQQYREVPGTGKSWFCNRDGMLGFFIFLPDLHFKMGKDHLFNNIAVLSVPGTVPVFYQTVEHQNDK